MMSFDDWLANVEIHFKSLSDEEKNRTLDCLIENSQSSQLYYLHKKLGSFLKRDFLALLPAELCHHLLRFLDVKTLLIACQVSRRWNEIISHCEERWMLACAGNGFQTSLPSPVCSYKQLWQKSVSFLHGIRDQSTIDTKMLFGHRDRVMAVYYHEGRLATGSDDRFVRLWDCDSGHCVRIFQTHTVADLKFDNNILVTGSFDTTAATWNMHSGQLIRQFQGHVAAVFSIDYTDTLLVTGSADSTVRVWGMDTGEVLKVLSQHRSAWITGVWIQQYQPNNFIVLSRDNTTIYMWTMQKKRDSLTISHDREVASATNLISGLHLKDGHVRYAALCSGQTECSIIEVKLWDSSGPVEKATSATQNLKLPPYQHIQSYLGSGSEFDVFLIDDSEHVPRLDIIRGEECLASIEIPAQYRSSKRGSTFTLGEQLWLDGFHQGRNTGVIFAASMKDNSVYVLHWKQIETE